MFSSKVYTLFCNFDILCFKVFPAGRADITDQLNSIRYGNISGNLLGKAVGKKDYQRAAQLISELSSSINKRGGDGKAIEGDDYLDKEAKETVSSLVM